MVTEAAEMSEITESKWSSAFMEPGTAQTGPSPWRAPGAQAPAAGRRQHASQVACWEFASDWGGSECS